MSTHQKWPIYFSAPVIVLVLFLAASRPYMPAHAPGSLASAQPPPQIAGCPIFPADNIWNTPIDSLPVYPDSETFVATIGVNTGLHPDFGAGLWAGGAIGIPFVDVPGDQPRVAVSFTYDDESDPGPYPVPTDAPIEGGAASDGDRHALVVERATCRLYELYSVFPQADGSWQADAGAVYDLHSNALRPAGWTSADAAGLPILPGLVRYDEVASGEIRHALRFTAPQTRRAYLWPARHFASQLTGAQYPPMGLRFRLKADFDISGYAPEVQVILTALKRYGMLLADNGSAWYISGVPDERWDNDRLRQLKGITGTNFEAVDVSSLLVDADSGRVAGESFLYLPSVRKDEPAASTATPTSSSTPTPTTSPTATPTATPTTTRTPTATATPSITPAATATKTVSPTASPTLSATPTATGSPTAIAADLFVDDENSTGVEDGSIQHPYNSVQEAIAAASSGQTIGVAAGLYPQNVRIQDKTLQLYGGYAGGTATDYTNGSGGDFSQRDSVANSTHLQGDGTDSTVTLLNAGASILDGFRITGGTRSLLPEFGIVGGGVYVDGGSPTISHNLIENNDTRPGGQPIQNEPVGGGVFAEDSQISILDNLIRNNTSGRGGGIAINQGSVVIRGNTVQGNTGVSDHGGGLYIAALNAQISYNRILDNEIGRDVGYGWGGGIVVFNEGNSATLSYNVITGNYAPSIGSGVFIDDGAQATLDHELIYANRCSETGGAAIYVDGLGDGPGALGSTVSIQHSTIASHSCTPAVGGNGLYLERNSAVTVTNSIFWGNGGDDFWMDATSRVTVTYTLAQESVSGPGNLSVDPLFAAPASQDYHLRSTGGRWDPAAAGGSGVWAVDAQHSPAIDAADPAADFAQEPAPNGGRANLGVYGNTAQASKASPVLQEEVPTAPTVEMAADEACWGCLP